MRGSQTPTRLAARHCGVHFELLAVLGHRERALVEARLRPRRYRRGQVLFNDGDIGDCLHIVGSGRLDVQGGTPAGALVTFRVVHPGEFVGELALVHPDNRRTGRVTALEAAETHALYRDDFELLRQEHPAVDRLLVTALAERLIRTSELVVEQLLPPEQRVWRRLVVLADAYSPGPIRMSQDDLAHAAGTVRQTVNRALRYAAANGVLDIRRGEIHLLDRAALEQLTHH